MMSVVRSRLATVARGSFSTATFRSVASRDPIGAYGREAPIRSVTSSMNATSPTTRYWSSMSLGEAKQFSTSSAKIEGRVREVSRAKRISFPLLYHINDGVEEILKDYVHHEITRTWIVIGLRLFYLIVIKDAFVFLFFSEQSEEPNRSFVEPGTTSKQLC